MTIFLVVVAILGWVSSLFLLFLLGLMSLTISAQQSREKELISDLEVYKKSANLVMRNGLRKGGLSNN
jgi:hypothetical protein